MAKAKSTDTVDLTALQTSLATSAPTPEVVPPAVDVPLAPIEPEPTKPPAQNASAVGSYLVGLLHQTDLIVEASSPEDALRKFMQAKNITASVHQPQVRLMTAEEKATHPLAKV
jgi:hypothetical protein